MKRNLFFSLLILFIALACITPTAAPTSIPTFDVKNLPTFVAQTAQALALSATATFTAIPSETPTASPTWTPTSTNTATITPTSDTTQTVTAIPSASQTITATVTLSTSTQTPLTPTLTKIPSKTPVPPTATDATVIVSDTPVPSNTPVPPSPTKTRTPVPSVCPESNTSFEARVIELINEERAKAGLPALLYQSQLAAAAQLHSADMACNGFFSHTAPDGSSPADRAARQGYASGFVGENIAAGYSTPKAVVDGWMNSPGHKANILHVDYKEIGLGYAYSSNSPYGAYWTAVFGSP